MNKSENRFVGLNEKRMLSVEEAAFYSGMGRTKCREWLREIGAVRKVGSRVICDRKVIDAALDQLSETVTA